MRSVRRWLVVAAALEAGCAASEGDELLSASEQAILDGDSASQDGLLGTVALVESATGNPYCTGTLVAPDVVLTAAHCGLYLDPETGQSLGKRDPSGVLVAVGVTTISMARAEDFYPVADIDIHPDYATERVDEAKLSGSLNDLAVISLAGPTYRVPPMPVLSPDLARQALQPGVELRLEGYGANDRQGLYGGGTLRYADVPLLRLGEHEFIAGEEGTSDACPGDSGGPVYLESNGTVALIGVTSRGLANATSACGGGGLYTLAPSYLDYLLEISPSPILVLGTLRTGNNGEDDPGDGSDQPGGGGADPQTVPSGEAYGTACQASPLPASAPSAIAMALGLFALALRRRRD